MSRHDTRVGRFEHATVQRRSYVIGFVSCLALTGAAYAVAVSGDISARAAMVIIGILAVLQCYVQLQRFLHLGSEFKPRWRLVMFLTMLTIVAIFVAGSLWIMSNLDYRMLHDSHDMTEYIESQDGL